MRPSGYFYPRSPCGERLLPRSQPGSGFPISIHALLAESDLYTAICCTSYSNFYPRSPCGERHAAEIFVKCQVQFLSTLSLRRATHYDNYNLHCAEISIHALLAESDKNALSNVINRSISIHALLAESDSMSCWSNPLVTVFLSTLSLRRATAVHNTKINKQDNFYPRSPCGERRNYF